MWGVANAPTRNVTKRIINSHNVGFLAMMEPMAQPDPDLYSKLLGLDFKGANTSGKIWIFVEEGASFEVIDDSEQVLHGRLSSPICSRPIYVSTIYAKCSRGARLRL